VRCTEPILIFVILLAVFTFLGWKSADILTIPGSAITGGEGPRGWPRAGRSRSRPAWRPWAGRSVRCTEPRGCPAVVILLAVFTFLGWKSADILTIPGSAITGGEGFFAVDHVADRLGDLGRGEV
jgi:hypothetical protein